jgi:hypothetical protein
MKCQDVLIAAVLLFCIYSCKKEASRDQPYKDVLTSGPWQIQSLDVEYRSLGSEDTTVLWDTSVYHGYKVVFSPDGQLQVTMPGSPPATGTWFQYSYEGMDYYYVRMEVGGDELIFLNSTWTFVTHSLSKIDFELYDFGTVSKMTLLKE